MLLAILLQLAYVVLVATAAASTYRAWEDRGCPRLEEL